VTDWPPVMSGASAVSPSFHPKATDTVGDKGFSEWQPAGGAESYRVMVSQRNYERGFAYPKINSKESVQSISFPNL